MVVLLLSIVKSCPAMHRFLIVFIGFLYLKNAYSYVLLQNRQENDNLSNGEVRKNQNPTDVNKYSKSGRRQFDDETNSLESVVLAIDSGVKQLISGQSQPDIIDNIAKSIVDFAKYSADPIYRSKGQEYNIKPEIIHFRSNKPSVMFEINSKSIINVLRDMLQSKTVHKYMDKFSKEAAIIYRTLRRELEKPRERHSERNY